MYTGIETQTAKPRSDLPGKTKKHCMVTDRLGPTSKFSLTVFLSFRAAQQQFLPGQIHPSRLEVLLDTQFCRADESDYDNPTWQKRHA